MATPTSATPSSRSGWECPHCGRQLPRQVEMCRCGAERTRLEALGYRLVTTAGPAVAAAPVVIEPVPGLAGTLIGYRPDAMVGRGWRIALKTLFLVAVALVGAALVTYTHTPLPPTRENVRVLSTLETHTRSAGPNAANTIPAFLALPGTAAILESSMMPADPLKTLHEADLRQGFCSESIAKQVRYQYPGFYEGWEDDTLERTVLEKYPEYQDRLCVLSSQVGASPDDIVKYELLPRSLFGLAGLWLRTLLITALFALACMNVYYRLLVPKLASA